MTEKFRSITITTILTLLTSFTATPQLALQVSALTENTPMHGCGGALGGSSVSYAAINQRVASSTSGYADKYDKFVVDYVVEWDKVLTTRVSAGLKTTEGLRRDLDHYQKKVEEMRVQSNKVMAKGKIVDEKTTERLKRNEEKLVQAKESFNKAARDMCMLLEETTDRSWKDLHPILVKMAQFDMTLASDEAKGLAEMDSIVTALKGLAGSNDLKSSGRLKELAAQEASLLYTGNNSGTVALTNGDVSTQIEGMGSSMGSGSGSFGETSLPPGSVAPQGMGGFPVRIVEPSPSPGMSRDLVVSPPTSGNSTWANSFPTPTTSEMLSAAGSAAPPPTLDQIEAVGGLYQSISLESFGSSRSGSVAPPPFSPPPPPPPDTSPAQPSYPPFSPPPPPEMSPAQPSYQFYSSMTSPQANSWSAPPPVNPTYGGTPSQFYSTSNSSPFVRPTTYGMPSPVNSNSNSFGPPPGGYPPTNPFAY